MLITDDAERMITIYICFTLVTICCRIIYPSELTNYQKRTVGIQLDVYA